MLIIWTKESRLSSKHVTCFRQSFDESIYTPHSHNIEILGPSRPLSTVQLTTRLIPSEVSAKPIMQDPTDTWHRELLTCVYTLVA